MPGKKRSSLLPVMANSKAVESSGQDHGEDKLQDAYLDDGVDQIDDDQDAEGEDDIDSYVKFNEQGIWVPCGGEQCAQGGNEVDADKKLDENGAPRSKLINPEISNENIKLPRTRDQAKKAQEQPAAKASKQSKGSNKAKISAQPKRSHTKTTARTWLKKQERPRLRIDTNVNPPKQPPPVEQDGQDEDKAQDATTPAPASTPAPETNNNPDEQKGKKEDEARARLCLKITDILKNGIDIWHEFVDYIDLCQGEAVGNDVERVLAKTMGKRARSKGKREREAKRRKKDEEGRG